jgi:hypothetical protein
LNAVAPVSHVYGSVKVADAIEDGLLAGLNVVLQPACVLTPSSKRPMYIAVSVPNDGFHVQEFVPPPDVSVAVVDAAGVTALLADDQAPWPSAFTAATRNVTAVPLVRLVLT